MAIKKETLNLKTAATMYDIKESTLRWKCIRGEISATKVGRKWYVDAQAMERLFKGEEVVHG